MSSISRLPVWAVLALIVGLAGCSGESARKPDADAGARDASAAGSGGEAGATSQAGAGAGGREALAGAGGDAGGDAAAASAGDGAGGAGRGGAGGRAAAGSGGGGGSAAVSGGGSAAVSGGGGGGAPSGWWKPKPGTSWQWQLTGRLDASLDVAAYDIDLFNTSAATIGKLHEEGRKVICYMDTAYEPDRPDSEALAPFRGNPVDGWPGQYWLDVREPEVLRVMKARIAQAQEKGCDAIEADDVDARSNNPGFPIRAAQQQAFIRALANEAHARGLAFGLKNDLEEIDGLLDVSDFAINEECFEYDECEALMPFIAAGKAVFHVEYSEDDLDGKASEICPAANRMNFDTLIKRLDLDAERRACR